MASSSPYYPKPNNNKNKSPVNASNFEIDTQENTIYVNVDPSNFGAVVQKLTGASTDPTIQKLPPRPFNENHNYVGVGPVSRPSLNLQQQRHTRNLHLQLNQNGLTLGESVSFGPAKRMMDASPVSTLDTFWARGSTQRTPVSPFLQEEIAIANKGFYLHPRPLAAARQAEPELLPLFPTSPDSSNEGQC